MKCLSKLFPVENVAGGEDLPRRLIGDDVALVAALKRENATGANKG
jgi:hypothetical protein